MITVPEIIKTVRLYLNERDESNSFFLDIDILDAINRALPIISRDTLFCRVNLLFETVPGEQEYGIPSTIFYVLNVSIKEKLSYLEYETYLREYSLEYSEKGIPTHYYLVERYDEIQNDTILVIGFLPIPDKTYTVNMYVAITVLPVNLTPETIGIPLPRYFMMPIVYLCLRDLNEIDCKFNLATYFKTRYDEEIEKIKALYFKRVPDYVGNRK